MCHTKCNTVEPQYNEPPRNEVLNITNDFLFPSVVSLTSSVIKRFSGDLEMKTRGRNRNNKRTEIERFDWFIERIQTRVAFGWLSERSGEKLYARELSRNQSILRFDVLLQQDWPIEQCLLHIRVFFGGKTKSPCFDLIVHWLITDK